jgi:hypothetical protein
MLVRDAILRDLDNPPDPIVYIEATARLATDINEYVLTDRLAGEFVRVLEPVIESARPGRGPSEKVGIWVSGFFGSGKSHFAKLAGHVLADTPVGADTARGLFAAHLRVGRSNDERLAGLLQEARNYRLACHLVAFDIQSLQAPGMEVNAGLIFLRAFYQSLGLSARPGVAEAELDLRSEGKYDEFLRLYQQRTGRPWDGDKNRATATSQLAACLSDLLPRIHPTAEKAAENVNAAMIDVTRMFDIDRVVDRLLRWLDGGAPQKRLIFVADEVGGWAGSDLKRIEQLRALVETFGQRGDGRLWLLATSQERLSDVVENTPADKAYLQRLEARFQINVHLESSDVGSVIEDRILEKRPDASTALAALWESRQALLRDIAEPPGLELQANYPRADRSRFARDYPFLPYQLTAAADLFGAMRGVRVSSGARSMLKVAFDATRSLAERPLGSLVTWDAIFDAANSGNEFADEQYLGSQGLDYIGTADRDVTGITFACPSRILKALWLVQQSPRIPRTERNLARLLTPSTDTDVLLLEQQVAEALAVLERHNFVRQEAGGGQWKFLTQDEVTVEKIVKRLAEGLSVSRIRREVTDLCAKRLAALFTGTIPHGQSNTRFDFGLSLDGNALKNADAPVQLTVLFEGSSAAESALAQAPATLESPRIVWILPPMPRLEERLRRALGIEALSADEEYRRIATSKTEKEGERLLDEAAELRRDAESDVDDLFRAGRLVYAGQVLPLDAAPSARVRIDQALHERIDAAYSRFADGDRAFKATNIERLFTTPPGDRAALDPTLAIFSADGHVNSNTVLVEALSGFLRRSLKTAGSDIVAAFAQPPFGWQADLLRYLAAALFVDGKASAEDRAGVRFDDPRSPQTRSLFGTQAFRTTRFLIEEEALSPIESDAARDLLTRLGRRPEDGGEIPLREATLRVCAALSQRAALVARAAAAGLPLPPIFEGTSRLVDEIQDAGSRVKVVRALLTNAAPLLELDAALRELEAFDKAQGFEQFRRSRELLTAAIEAGLRDDAVYGAQVAEAEKQTAEILAQRRVLETWSGIYRTYRQQVLDAFRDTYAPLRETLHERSTAAQKAVRAMPEFTALGIPDRATIRAEFFGEGRPLQEVTLPELKDEAQLLAANRQLSISYLRLALANLDAELGRARARVIQLYATEQERKGEAARTATWSPAQAFAGLRFETPEQVDSTFDAAKAQLKALIQEGKTVEVV